MKLLSLVIFALVFALSSYGCAPPPEGGGGGGREFLAFLPFILIFVLFYFLILRPQRRQELQRQAMLKALKRGDNVLTSGGIYGKIVNIEEDILTVEIAKGVNIRMNRAGVASVLEKKEEIKKPS
ncbi:MAG: preprotein translocase subunit YajC [Candidatus Caldarchaeum sp.]